MNEETPAPETVAVQSAEPAPTLEEARENALDFIEGLLDAMDLDGDVAGEIEEDGQLRISIEGADGGYLIGRKGRTLEAIQELLRAAVQRSAGARIKMTVDVDGYRDRRRQAVESKAAEAVQRVLDEGGEIELEPMTAFERKLVHDVVAGHEGVTSYSEGEDPRRKVIVSSEE
ncbi:MAG: protein jag [Actinomycetota bacterium]